MNRLIALLFRIGLWLAQWVKPAMALRSSAWLAALLDRFDAQAAQTTRANLAVCFPDLSEAERSVLCRHSLQNMVLLFFEFAQLAHWPLDRLLDQIKEAHGKALLDAFHAQGEGALLLVPHFGNWEVLCAFLGENYGFAALYDPPKISEMEPTILKARQRFQGELFAIDAGGMRGLLKAMQQGAMVALLPDQVPERDQGVYAPFFGQPALTMTLAHRLAAKSGNRVLLTSVRRIVTDNAYHYCLSVEPLIEDVSTLDAQGFAAVMNASIERLVRQAPEQYQWEYKRFKRPPQRGTGNIYRRQ